MRATERGVALRGRGLRDSDDSSTDFPLRIYRLTSRYGMRSAIPEAGVSAQQHNGLDLAAPAGSPIYSVTGGVVIHVGNSDWMDHTGWIVAVQSPDGTVVSYNHMAADGVFVETGQAIEVGEHIADVGSEGRSSGPHLHLAVRPDGVHTVDPSLWLAERGLDV